MCLFHAIRSRVLPRVAKHKPRLAEGRRLVDGLWARLGTRGSAETPPARSSERDVGRVELPQDDRAAGLALSARLPSEDDLGALVVAMSAPNFESVRARLESQRCVVVFQASRLVAYFWLAQPERSDQPDVPVQDWGVRENFASETTVEQAVCCMLRCPAGTGVNAVSAILPLTAGEGTSHGPWQLRVPLFGGACSPAT